MDFRYYFKKLLIRTLGLPMFPSGIIPKYTFAAHRDRSFLARSINSYADRKGEFTLIDDKNYLFKLNAINPLIAPSAYTLSSWLPLFPSQETKIFVNNFFAANYSKRLPILVQCTVFSTSGELVWTKALFIQPYKSEIISIDNLPIDNDSSQNSFFVYVQCFSPQISVEHGGHNGYYRVHGFYSKSDSISEGYSVVHSMPFSDTYSLEKVNDVEVPSERAFCPLSFSNTSLSLFTLFNSAKKASQHINNSVGIYEVKKCNPNNLGYVCVNSQPQLGIVSGIWHDGPRITGISAPCLDDDPRVIRFTGFFVPSFIHNAPFFLFDPGSLGFSEACHVLISASCDHISCDKFFEFDGNRTLLDTKNLFADSGLSGPTSFRIGFKSIASAKASPLMVHALMRDSAVHLGDGLHTQSGWTNIRPNESKPGGMRIWGPYFRGHASRLKWTYCLHNVYAKDDPSGHIKVRIFTDTSHEYIHNIESLHSLENYSLSCDQLDSLTGFKNTLMKTAVIQFESTYSSIQGGFWVYDQSHSLCGCDHLTGG